MEEKKELLDQDERVVEIELERLRGFVNHPFKVQANSQMIELQESIKKYGILNPLIVRPRQDTFTLTKTIRPGIWYLDFGVVR